MENTECDFYYKVVRPKATQFYGIRVISYQSQDVDALLDQVKMCRGIFIGKEEFDRNIREPMELDIVDYDTQSRLIGKVIFEKIDLSKAFSEDKVFI
ncbi:MAG TPA: hypothetical protein VIV55_09885 [Flavobacterium sp.]